jgi:hypothetical protein
VLVQHAGPAVAGFGQQFIGAAGAVKAAHGLLGQPELSHDRLDAVALGAQFLDLLVTFAGAPGQGGGLCPRSGRRGGGLLKIG